MTPTARLVLGLSLVVLSACSDPESPEALLRQTLGEAEAAAEERDVGFFRKLIAEDYSDKQGRTRADIIELARLYFLRHRQSIHVLSRIESIEFPIPELASVELLAGMAGRDQDAASVWDLQADVYRFELEMRFSDSGGWKLIGASWRRGVQK